MNQVEKNNLLQQVSSILQFCQEIVSRLSSSSSSLPPEVNNNFNDLDKEAATLSTIAVEASVAEHYNDQIRELPNPDEETHKELIETIAKFRDEKQEHHDIVDVDNDLWWDNSYPPLHFYTLVYDDDELSLFDVDSSSSLHQLSMTEDGLMLSAMMEDVSMQVAMLEDKPDNVLMNSVLQFLHDEIPSAIYDPNWREERKKKAIHPEFYSLWKFSNSIFTDVKDEEVIISPMAVDEIKYHTIDLHSVNARFIGNIPKPDYHPVHGVSQDPDFYHRWYPRDEPVKTFLKPFPFGGGYGYDTDVGIVPPPTDPIHGYVWRGGGWVLHAVKPGEGSSVPRRRRG